MDLFDLADSVSVYSLGQVVGVEILWNLRDNLKVRLSPCDSVEINKATKIVKVNSEFYGITGANRDNWLN